MSKVTIYTTATCPYCVRAKLLLDDKQVAYTEIDVSEVQARANMTEITGGTTVPQLVINGQATGGCDELYALQRSGKLDSLLAL